MADAHPRCGGTTLRTHDATAALGPEVALGKFLFSRDPQATEADLGRPPHH